MQNEKQIIIIIIMKVYQLNSVLNFGKYKGRSIEAIAKIDPTYIDWCSRSIDDFFISEDDASQIESIGIGFKYKFKKETLTILNEKPEIMNKELEYLNNRNSNYENENWEEDAFDALTDGMLGDWDDFGGDIDDAMLYLRG